MKLHERKRDRERENLFKKVNWFYYRVKKFGR